VVFDRNADAEQQLACARFGRVAVVLGELRFEFGGVHVVVVGGLRVRVDRIALGHGVPHFGVAHHHDVEHTYVFVRELILAQLAQAHIRFEHHVAGARFQIAAQDLHEGGLAAAIRTNQAIAVPSPEFDRDVLEQGLRPELHGDICGRQHGASFE
jgi:hypothetical protein